MAYAESLILDHAVTVLQQHGMVIYPTETFYALGCLCSYVDVINSIYRLKERDLCKPMPIIAESADQVNAIADISCLPPGLIESFWPGPLTLILPCRLKQATPLRDNKNKIAIRVTSNPVAAQLCKDTGEPLIATSANLSGDVPGQRISELNPDFLQKFDQLSCPHAIIDKNTSTNHYRAPSTIVEPVRTSPNQWRLRIIREGAISVSELKNNHFEIIKG